MGNSVKVWVSRGFTGIVTLALTATAAMKIGHAPKMVDGLTHAGIPESAVIPIALLEIVCLVLCLVPRTMVLGAVLLTGYFGGAIVVHIIGHESVFPVILIGAWVWGGIYFRVPSLQDLLPFRRDFGAGMDTSDMPRSVPARRRTSQSSV
jgi:DoxX-like family